MYLGKEYSRLKEESVEVSSGGRASGTAEALRGRRGGQSPESQAGRPGGCRAFGFSSAAQGRASGWCERRFTFPARLC